MKSSSGPVLSPLTKSEDVTHVGDLSAEDLIERWKNVFEIDIIPQLKGIEKVDIYKCNRTGFVFFWPPSLEGDETLYKQLSRFDWYYMEDKWEYIKALEDLKGHGRVLEIGCGRGFFLEKLKARGINGEGLETNRDAICAAKNKGLRVFEGLSELAQPLYDAVCSFQTLEHVANPHEFLELAIKLVKPGGRLILSMPNNDSFLKNIKNHLLDQPPHHMGLWKKSVLEKIQTIFPIKLVKWKSEPLAAYHLDLYISTLNAHPRVRRFLKRKLQPALVRRFIKGHTMYAAYVKRA